MAAPRMAFPNQCVIRHFRSDPTDPEGQREPVGETAVICNLQPQWSREDTANQDQQSESWNLYLPAGTDLGHQDVVLVFDLELEAYGAGRQVGDFKGRPHHVEAVVRRTR